MARVLIEDAIPDKVGPKTSVFVNRLMMRFFTVPSVLQALSDIGVVPCEEANGKGKTTVQLDFQRLPEEAIPVVMNLIACPTKLKFLRYVKDGQARNGFEFELNEADLPGDEFSAAN